MIIKNGKTISSIYKGSQVIDKIMKGTLVVYESWKNLIASGVPPLTLLNCKGVDLVDYKIYGKSIQETANNHNLPSEYREVEYIESTGTQYIDTGVIPNQNTGFDIVYLSKDKIANSDFGCILGTREKSSVEELQLTSYSNDASSLLGTLRFGATSSNAGITINKKMHSTLINKVYTNNDDVEITLSDTFTSPKTLTIFALNNNGTITQYGNVQLYSLKLYDGETLVRDFVPCYRKSDKELGLYDLVGKKFYANAGTGEFIKGVGIPTPQTPIEVESVGNKTKNLLKTENVPIKKESVTPTSFVDFRRPFVFIDYAPSGYSLNSNNEFKVENNTITWSSNKEWYGVGFSFKPKKGVTYKVSFVKNNPEVNYSTAYYSNGYFTRMGNTVISLEDEETDVIICFRASTKGTFSVSNAQLEEGETITAYEPYGYKIPVKASGKNLFDKNNAKLLNGWVPNTNGEGNSQINYANTTKSIYIPCEPNKTYTASKMLSRRFAIGFANDVPTTGTVLTNVKWNGNVTSLTSTAPSDAKYLVVWFYHSNYDTDLTYQEIMETLQIEEGSIATNYEEYKEPITTTIYLKEPLRKIEDYADYIDFKNKKVVRNIKSLVLDNTYTPKLSNWQYLDGYYAVGYGQEIIPNSYKTNEIGYVLCDQLPNKTYNNLYSTNYPQEGIATNSTALYSIFVRLKTDTITTYNEYKEYLKGNPLNVYCVITTPIEETIELPNIPTIKGTTILDVDTTLLPSNLEVFYKGK